MLPNPLIGVTERGDAALDLSWVNKLNTVDGCIVITKNPTVPALQDALLKNKHKCILHATITGNGATPLEPHVPSWKQSLQAVIQLVKAGFPKNQVVIRVDPIAPWNPAPSEAVIRAAYQAGFRRFRVSVMDYYNHVLNRFRQAGYLAPFQDGRDANTRIAAVDDILKNIKTAMPEISLEACAEPGLHIEHRGCVSEKDLDILGIDHGPLDKTGFQRSLCMCYSGKRELLTQRHRCPHGCLYCYWKD